MTKGEGTGYKWLTSADKETAAHRVTGSRFISVGSTKIDKVTFNSEKDLTIGSLKSVHVYRTRRDEVLA